MVSLTIKNDLHKNLCSFETRHTRLGLKTEPSESPFNYGSVGFGIFKISQKLNEMSILS